jgi:hypothetical protein
MGASLGKKKWKQNKSEDVSGSLLDYTAETADQVSTEIKVILE